MQHRGQSCINQDALDVGQQQRVTGLAREYIDADALERKATGAPERGLLTGGANDPAADVEGDRTFRERIDKHARSEHAAHRVPPTQQRFRADDSVVGQPNLRLEMHLELVLGKGATKFVFHAAPRLCLGAQDWNEKAVEAAAIRLRLIKREV